MAKRATKRKPTVEKEPLVNAFAAQHGDYHHQEIVDAGGELGEGRNRRFHALVNRGGSPVARWHKAGQITDLQLKTITYMQKLWRTAWGTQSVVQDLNRIRGSSPSSGLDQQYAIDDIKDIESRVPVAYWRVFESVCRDGEPAGVAGSQLATRRDDVAVAARICVCFVADLIATWKRF